MKLKYFLFALLLSSIMAQSYQLISQTIITGYSDVFTFGGPNYAVPNIFGYSGVFDMNTMGTYIAGQSGLFTLNTIGAQINADFTADQTNIELNNLVQFTDLSGGSNPPISWVWNFGDGSTGSNRYLQNPEHLYSNTGMYSVSLTVTNSAGVQDAKTKTNFITINSQNNGILLYVLKSDPGSGPTIAKAGYHYTIKKKNWLGKWIIEDVLVNNFNIDQNGYVHINYFPTQSEIPVGTILEWSFNDEIIFFDQNNNRIGHIKFSYIPDRENDFIRNAILIFHNDAEICQGNSYPYNHQSPDYDSYWKYYQIGEYPVSMLIPPNNAFLSTYSKIPLLLIHGWEGSYSFKINPDAIAINNEVSYWFTTVKLLNQSNSLFDTWQYYYPYNSSHHHIATCLKSALSNLKSFYSNQKIGIITHSMGGLVTLRYLTQYPDDAKLKIEKVLFMAPPAHGSLGANLYYKTIGGPILQMLVGYDRHAPGLKDMKLGSDATWFIHNNLLPDLNNQDGVYDDYFVMLGTTYKFYQSDTYVQLGGSGPHNCIHEEAINHHDGIVSISSGSLLDKGVGFATFHGNHDDAVHMQSYKRNNIVNQNIGDVDLLPNIVKQYFINNYTAFITSIKNNQYITSIINHEHDVIKPAGQNLDNLNTNNGVDYQKGLINLGFIQTPIYLTYLAYYSKGDRVLHVIPKTVPGNFLFKGVFKVNTSSNDDKRYYFNDDKTLFKKNITDEKSSIYNGCAMTIEQGTNTLVLKNILGFQVARQDFEFGYCETNNITIESTKLAPENVEDNYTDIKERYIVSTGTFIPDSLVASFNIDNETTLVDFNISSLESALFPFTVMLKMKLPDGTIADSTFATGTFQHDMNLGIISMEIPDPMPGKWHVWLESEYPGADTLLFNAIAFLQSDVFAYLPDTMEAVTANTATTMKSALKVNDFDLADGLTVHATVYKPDWQEEVFDITASAITQDSSYIFSLDYIFPLAGEYLIKYNIDGIYNDFGFERCLHQMVVAVDTIAVLNIPDITLRQQEPQTILDLDQYLFNVEDYDTVYFSSEMISSVFDSLAFSATMDSLSLKAYLSASLSEAGEALFKYTCHYDDNTVEDTVKITVLLPELHINSVQVSDTIISNGSDLYLDYSIDNTGTFDAAAYEVRYYITQDSLIESGDFCIDAMPIMHHPVDSLLAISDTLKIPALNITGEYYLAVVADALNQIAESDETNNLVLIPMMLNNPPLPPQIVSVVPDYESVHLTWTANNQTGINGYVIYYGMNINGVLTKKYILSTDTTSTITELSGNKIYYFAVSAYKILGVESELSDFVSATPLAPLTQQLNMQAGWSGISSYTSPFDNNVELIFDPILSDLIILKNASGMFWPGQNINTLGTWHTHEGYQVKVADNVELTISGARENDKTLQLAEGWNLIPVLSECDVDVAALFDGTDIVILKEVAGWNVYWPEFGINTLGVLEPGKAYFVMMGSEGDVTFPECQTPSNSPLRGRTAHPSKQLNGHDLQSKNKTIRSNVAALRAGTPLLLQ
nr:PKD domain-containing protein [Bacteroidota bacterium]